jgi:hypothetical protein
MEGKNTIPLSIWKGNEALKPLRGETKRRCCGRNQRCHRNSHPLLTGSK